MNKCSPLKWKLTKMSEKNTDKDLLDFFADLLSEKGNKDKENKKNCCRMWTIEEG